MSNFDNPYAPVSTMGLGMGTRYPLASLGQRLGATLLDGLISFVAFLPGLAAFLFDAAQQQQNGNGQIGPIGIVGFILMLVAALALAVLQIYLLVTRSQTIGKYLVNTQIVDFESGQPAGFVKTFVLRAFVNGLIGVIPMVGPIYSIVDILFIFRADRRCIHDLLASTSVVDISGQA